MKDQFRVGDIVWVELLPLDKEGEEKARGQIIDIYDYGDFQTFEVQFENGRSKEVLRNQIIKKGRNSELKSCFKN
ncbi:MAG TPA: hypothetical protein PLY02_01310 [Candidatus Pacearchaeota archaeon]|nr:hypothetical protein [Candidatus Pacearchaeota archaeon]HOK94153.1 hypothetical protein [Candidatus Pacearchaeota archaeon]